MIIFTFCLRLQGCYLGGPLRYTDAAVLWVQSDQAVLDERCNKRVDKMIEQGMIRELEQFHKVLLHLVLKLV